MTYDLVDLQLFLRVVDEGSITQGAEKSHLALATASARISAMEKALGAPLLERHRRGVTPSPAGWLLVAHARSITEHLTRMHYDLARLSDNLQSRLVLLANTSAVETFAAGAITEFMARNPDIDIELKELPSHDTVAAVAESRSELGLIADTVDAGRLECTMIRPDPLVVVAGPDHELAGRARISFSECLEHTFVGFIEGNPLQEHLSGRSQPLGLRPRYRARLPNTESICRAVAAGIGIAVLPALAASRWRRELSLRAIDLTNSWAQRSLLLCARRWTELSEPAAALARHLTGATAE